MATGEQRYAFGDGTVKESPQWQAPKASEQKSVVERALAGSQHLGYSWVDEGGRIKEVILENSDGTKTRFRFAQRSVSGGGRPAARPDELRVQLDPEIINTLFTHNCNDEIALIIGVYCNEGVSALAIWRPLDGSTGSGSASKQIDAHVVARALTNGVASCVYPDGEIVYVIAPEMLRAYIDCLMPGKEQANYLSALKSQNDPETEREPRNLIYFGAPGTGKSYQLDKKAEALFDEDKIVCATFYPDYTYAQFVGCYKPYTDSDGEKKITYKFIPGPFLKVYLNAITHPEEQYLLKIEELNRANPAAVFGDVFQLLDRDENGNSEYNVEASIDMGNCIDEFFDKLSDDETEALESYYDDLGFEGVRELSIAHLSIPSNMYIWATMNSADQGVFPMDTAFKRRWDFRYMDIDAGADVISDYIVPLGETGKRVRWNGLRVGINNVLRRANINEDKWLGPFFIKPDVLKDGQAFLNAFKDKVLLYLYEDAAKSKPGKVFADKSMTYSEVCKKFMAEGVAVFFEFNEEDIEYLPADADNVAADEGETLEG